MSAAVHVGVDATTWWNERGFGRFTRELLGALAERDTGFRYTLVTDRVPQDAQLPPGVEVLTRTTGRTLTEAAVQDGARSPADMLQLSRLVAGADFDVFFFPAVYSFFPLLRPLPSVVAFHDTIAERYPRLVFPTRRNELFWRAKCALAKHQARRIMTVSDASARDLVDILGVAPHRIDRITEGPDPIFRVLPDAAERAPAVCERYGLPDRAAGEPLLVYVGGLSPHKNLLGLLRAWPGVLAGRGDAHLAIVGDTSGKGFFDNQTELRRFVSDTPGLSERVHFTGYVDDEDLVVLYNTATGLVFPSLWEGFGLPAVEAMACGLPVLASDRASLPEVVGDAGLLFDPHSPQQITTAVLSLLDDDNLRETLRERSLSRVAQFTWARGAELAEDSFRRCLDRSGVC